MKSFPPERIRNVALVGHSGSGKTSLVEALALAAGHITRRGRVEDGTTISDHQPEARKRQVSVAMGLVPIEWKDHKINLIDCPGAADFAGEAALGLSVADLAVFVISAVDGLETDTRHAWRAAERAGIPRMIFVNKLDRERADFESTVNGLREVFGEGVAPIEMPLGTEADFRGVVDLFRDQAVVYTEGAAELTEVPEELAGREHAIHDALVEGIVVADDEMTAKYLDGEVPSIGQLEKTMAKGVAEATVFPVVAGSATSSIGVDRLADFICEIGSSPLDRSPAHVQVNGQDHPVNIDPAGEPLVKVFKTVVDPYLGKVSLFKVVSGTIATDQVLVNSRTRTDERLHALFSLRGKDHVEIESVPAGDICAVGKLADTATFDTLAPATMPVEIPSPWLPEPVFSLAVKPTSAGDDDKLMSALHKLADEDPSLRIEIDDDTHQTVLSGLGDVHLTVILERLTDRYGVKVETEDVKIRYRETIKGPVTVEGKFKKQSGGHGQFGVVTLEVAPAESGSGLVFSDRVTGGVVPKQFIPAVEKGVREAMSNGGPHGFNVVDLQVVLTDGRHHSVDSSEMSFKMAGALALGEALKQAGTVILEPMSELEVAAPTELQGELLGDLNTRRARVHSSEQNDEGEQIFRAVIPSAELVHYAAELRSKTAGQGRFKAVHDHYAPLPEQLVSRLAP